MKYQTPEVEEGIDHKNYDINPHDLNFENEMGGSTKQQMNTTHQLKKIKDSDLWIRYNTAPSPKNKDGWSIDAIGTLDYEAVDLGISGNDIVSEATNEIGDDEVLKRVTEKSDELAESLQEEWKVSVEDSDIIGEPIESGTIGVNHKWVFTAYVLEAFVYEVKHVVQEHGFEDDDDVGAVLDTVLREAVKVRVEDRHSRPHAEYMAKLNLTDGEKWQIRAIEIEQNSPLPRQTAKVVALKGELKTNIDIGNKLGIDNSTVGRHLDRAERIMEESEWMVENVEL